MYSDKINTDKYTCENLGFKQAKRIFINPNTFEVLDEDKNLLGYISKTAIEQFDCHKNNGINNTIHVMQSK